MPITVDIGYFGAGVGLILIGWICGCVIAVLANAFKCAAPGGGR